MCPNIWFILAYRGASLVTVHIHMRASLPPASPLLLFSPSFLPFPIPLSLPHAFNHSTVS